MLGCAQEENASDTPRRIIDVHIHAISATWAADATPYNPATRQRSTAKTGADLLPETLRQMDAHNVVLGILSGPLEIVKEWTDAAPNRFIGAPQFPMNHSETLDLVHYKPSMEDLGNAVRAGWVGAIGEITAQYAGILPSDAALDPYLKFATENDLPVGFHTGRGTIRIIGSDEQENFRVHHGNPVWINEVLARYPNLRVYLMHAGYPYLDDTIALMAVYHQVYVDLSRETWSLPRVELHRYLSRLIDAGFGERIMFGSDGTGLPESIGLAIDGIESAGFLTEQQKADIFFNNAVRFFRLDENALANP